jgi:hypothetical protein
MTKEELDAIRERADKATPGPWEWTRSYDIGSARLWALHNPLQPDGGVGDGLARITNYYLVLRTTSKRDMDGTPLEQIPDFQFIAHAREDIPRLCDELAAYKQALCQRGENPDELTPEKARRSIEGGL